MKIVLRTKSKLKYENSLKIDHLTTIQSIRYTKIELRGKSHVFVVF